MDFGEKPTGFDCGLGHACEFCPQETECELDKPHHNKVLIEDRLAEIDQILLVLANKGGVGKSTVSANLAAGLALRGFRVGMADADIHGPNQSRFFGFAGANIRNSDYGLETRNFSAPEIDHPVRVGSLAFMQQDDTTPIVWRDAYKHDFMHHLIGSFNWGPLDYLVIDMPPGTGNELITLCDMLEGSNVSAVLVSTPQAVAQMDSLKAGRYCNERGLPVIGAVSNMAGVVCPRCDNEFHIYPDADFNAALAALEIKKIAEIPLSPELAQSSDDGVPVVVGQPETAPAQAFAPLVNAVITSGQQDFDNAVARTVSEVFEQNLTDDAMLEALNELPESDRAEIGEQISALLNDESDRLMQAAESGAKK